MRSLSSLSSQLVGLGNKQKASEYTEYNLQRRTGERTPRQRQGETNGGQVRRLSFSSQRSRTSPGKKPYFHKDKNVHEEVALQRSEEHSRLRNQQEHRPQGGGRACLCMEQKEGQFG